MKKHILIIGGERGIGHAMAEQLLEEGHTVIVTSRSYAEITNITDHLWSVHCDLTSDQSIAQLNNQLSAHFSQIDWLINCAGILHTDAFMPEKSLNQINTQQLLENFHTNAVGHLCAIKALKKLIVRADKPVVASLSARIGSIADNKLGGWYAYRMSKAALNMGMKTLAIEWHRTHPKVKFLLLHPGTTDTALSKPFQKNLPQGQLQSAALTANLLIEQISKNQQHESKFPLFIDYKGSSIEW